MAHLKIGLVIIVLLISPVLKAQDDLEKLLEQEMGLSTEITSATFKTTRLINGHTIEAVKEGEFDFRVNHRFGRINEGAYEMFGLDQANTHFCIDLGVKDWLMIGLGRGTWQKTWDGSLKITLMRQSKGGRFFPFTITWMSGVYMNTIKWANKERTNYFSSRVSYAHQLLIARKFSTKFSAQFSPAVIHRNMTDFHEQPNDLYALGFGGRYKLSARFAVTVEYYKLIQDYSAGMFKSYDPLSVGFDVETGGHVFQLFLTNSLAMTESGFLGQTQGNWSRGDVHFGFNISRFFEWKKRK